MKRIIGMVIVIFFLLGASIYCFAQQSNDEKDKEKGKFSAIVSIKNDLGFPQESKDYTVQALCAYWHYQLPESGPNVGIGGGVDLRANFRDEFLEASPYMTFNYKAWYLLAGGVVDSKSQNYVQIGLWYIDSWEVKKIGKFNMFVDVRNYWPASSGKNIHTYIDNFVEVTYPIGKFFVGTDIEYIHWWKGPSHDWVSVGPLVGYKITKNVSVFVRPTYDLDIMDEATGTARIRFGLCLSF